MPVNILNSCLAVVWRQKLATLAWLAWLLMTAVPGLFAGTGAGVCVAIEGAVILLLILGCVFTVVEHADALAERLGEPYGTLVLTLSATAIEATLLLSVMLSGEQNPTLLRDTVFATLMVALNGLVGLALTAGGWRHIEQAFNLRGALAFLHIIAPLSLLILVLPNFTRQTPGPTLAPVQEAFMGILCVLVYAVFLRLQVGRHRSHFAHVVHDSHALASVPGGQDGEAGEAGSLAASLGGLLFALLPIMLLSERVAAILDYVIEGLRLPAGLGGLIVTALVLSPEGMGALRAAVGNRVQRAINICLGSALSTIALTIPTVLIAAALLGHALVLGIDQLDVSLLYATLIVAFITFVSGRANLLQGVVHLMIFAAYLFFMFFP